MTNRVQVTKEGKGRGYQWANLCLESAMFSAIVYRGAAPSDDPKSDYVRHRTYEEILAKRGWRRHGVCDRTEKGDGQGLYFEVWENRTRKPRQIIFAFRGTRGGADWGANLRWFRPYKRRDHYLAAREECIPLIENFYKEKGGEKLIISTTGHSLGGGIAQAVLYAASDKVDHSIVFDPSPVTALHELSPTVKNVYRQQLNRSEFSQYRIIRAYERGEILMFARNLVSLVHKPDTQTISIEFDTPGRATAVGKHSITLLTDHLRDLIKNPPPAVSPVPFVSSPLQPTRAYKKDPN